MRASAIQPLLLGSVLLVIPPALAADVLEPYQWQNRLLLLFAPAQTDAKLQESLKQIHARRCEFENRDMLPGIFLDRGQSSLGDKRLSSETVADLRRDYRIEARQFAVLLIGKDGEEKYRTYASPDLETIFDLIDGMPMRQQEMRVKPGECH